MFGATYGQGYRYGRPGPLPVSMAAPLHVIPLSQRLAPLDGQTPFETVNALMPAARGHKAEFEHISRHLEAQSAAGEGGGVLLAGFQDRQFFSTAARERYDRLSAVNALTVVLADGLDIYEMPRYHVGPLSAQSRMNQEWVVIVLRPHFAAAFVARDCGETDPSGRRCFDYIFTHDRDAVVAAARSYMHELSPTPMTDTSMAATGLSLVRTGPDDSHRVTFHPRLGSRVVRVPWISRRRCIHDIGAAAGDSQPPRHR